MASLQARADSQNITCTRRSEYEAEKKSMSITRSNPKRLTNDLAINDFNTIILLMFSYEIKNLIEFSMNSSRFNEEN